MKSSNGIGVLFVGLGGYLCYVAYKGDGFVATTTALLGGAKTAGAKVAVTAGFGAAKTPIGQATRIVQDRVDIAPTPVNPPQTYTQN